MNVVMKYIRSCWPEESQLANCPHCGKSLKPHCLKAHIRRVHEGVKPNQAKSECDLCGKSYGGSYALERHKRTVHEGIKDYVCEEGATTGISMRDHTFRMHEGDKSHLITCCNECGKTHPDSS